MLCSLVAHQDISSGWLKFLCKIWSYFYFVFLNFPVMKTIRLITQHNFYSSLMCAMFSKILLSVKQVSYSSRIFKYLFMLNLNSLVKHVLYYRISQRHAYLFVLLLKISSALQYCILLPSDSQLGQRYTIVMCRCLLLWEILTYVMPNNFNQAKEIFVQRWILTIIIILLSPLTSNL